MSETIKQHDFIEIDYTGKLADGVVFDTTLESVAKENKLPTEKRTYKPALVCVGEKQLLPGLDAQLAGKEIDKEYTVVLPAEKAFGKRDVKKMKIVPANNFKEHKINPHPGLQVDIDGELGVITRVSGGRIIVNFNHPLSGKEITYTFTILRKVEDLGKQLSSYLSSSLRIPEESIKIDIKDKTAEIKLSFALPEQITALFSKKLVEITELDEIKFVQEQVKPAEQKNQ